MSDQYHALLWGDLLIGFLLRVAGPPAGPEITRRATLAADTVLRLYG
jgi:hypothetical protein